MRSDRGILEVVYDFIYRLTSSTVHFDPPTLMRQGWGELPQVTFSVRNMGPYYHAICMIYGTYIFCLYCESFEQQLAIDQAEKSTLTDLRKHLLNIFRWPEMVTFEEMNLPVPEPPFWPTALVKGIHDIILQNGFLAGAAEIVHLGTEAEV
jgi:hypothetical protein